VAGFLSRQRVIKYTQIDKFSMGLGNGVQTGHALALGSGGYLFGSFSWGLNVTELANLGSEFICFFFVLYFHLRDFGTVSVLHSVKFRPEIILLILRLLQLIGKYSTLKNQPKHEQD
jgi:hypothetical protein